MAVINSSRFNMKEDIAWAIQKYLENYNTDVIEVTMDVIPKVGREAAKKLRATSPRRAKGGGKYAKGWKCKVEKARMRVGATVYGESGTYQLAHLLENGHANRNGGRTAAIEHIKPVEEWASEEAMTRIIEGLNSI